MYWRQGQAGSLYSEKRKASSIDDGPLRLLESFESFLTIDPQSCYPQKRVTPPLPLLDPSTCTFATREGPHPSAYALYAVTPTLNTFPSSVTDLYVTQPESFLE